MPEKKPNILLVMTDQMTPLMTGAYGYAAAKTPNLDRLAAEGVLFENAYSSCPICAPARMSLLTGMYVSSINANDNTSILPSDEPTHNHYLSAAGYDTVLSGKLHAIGPDQLHGFAKRLTTDVYPADFNWLAICRSDPSGFTSAHEHPIAVDYVTAGVGVRQWSLQLDYDEETHFRGLEYLRRKRSQPSGTLQKALPKRDDTPFFLQVSYQHPHEPFHCLRRYWDLYEGVEIPVPTYPEELESTYTAMDRDLNTAHGAGEVDLKDPDSLLAMHRAYLGSMTYCDDKLGELLQALEDLGLADDTIVIFTSDHGDMLGHRGMIQKRTFYEQASRIPLIFRFPKNFPMGKPGAVVKDPVSIVDVCPTLLELSGIADYLPMDGKSLVPQLKGERDPGRYVFAENHSEGVTGLCFMVRRGRYKYNWLYQRDAQLFDMEADPGEWENLAGRPECREVEAELKGLILARFDPAAIERQLAANLRKRRVIKKALDAVGGPRWAYQPFVDANEQYWRKG
ncbi:MAG: choline-sulfatase [Kiritimatiellae bacterium]|nr:choline-sulfatase [Kiritimatiellia bacterium]